MFLQFSIWSISSFEIWIFRMFLLMKYEHWGHKFQYFRVNHFIFFILLWILILGMANIFYIWYFVIGTYHWECLKAELRKSINSTQNYKTFIIHRQSMSNNPHKKINQVQTEKRRDFLFFCDFNRDLTKYFAKWVFAKINLKKLDLNWLNLVKHSEILTEF